MGVMCSLASSLSLSLPPPPPMQGEYIAPEKIENIYIFSLYVAQVYLYGDSLKSACVAVVIPDEEMLMKWAKENGIGGSFEDVCKTEVRRGREGREGWGGGGREEG